MADLDLAHLKSWEGRSMRAADAVSPWLVAAFRATLDQDEGDLSPGAPAPQGLHWCLALPTAKTAELGPDGHPARGGFLPPVPLPRRMWAGGRVRFSDSLRIGETIERRSTVRSVELKDGRTGRLVFVVVEHAVSTARGLAITEEHDIVYRGVEAPAVRPGGQTRIEEATDARRVIEPSAALLFRYSALTFNGHRIHYDRRYVTEEEGYPGLIVHGPLQATLLIQLGGELMGRPLASFDFRATKPLFDLAPFTIAARRGGEGLELWAADAAGERTMAARAG
ncbi:MAG: MaoC family dehydratase N-terminal domain-containing protein [Methylobacteriaceae bacterium]|nr:MaoC family dehydratase N-terminal domain-containing protein [Methylobacteriaceae bacterium]